jgi:TolA-binding protein
VIEMAKKAITLLSLGALALGCVAQDGESPFDHAASLARVARYDEAIAVLDSVRSSRNREDDARALLMLGEIAARRGLFDEAFELFTRVDATGVRVHAADAALRRAQIFRWKHQEAKADTVLEEVISKFKDVPGAVAEAKLGLAAAAVEDGECEEARPILEELEASQAIETRRSAAWAEVNLASCSLASGDHKDALLRLLRVQRRWPEASDAVQWSKRMLVELYASHPDLLSAFDERSVQGHEAP